MKIITVTIFAVGMIFLFLTVMALGNKEIQVGQEYYGFTGSGITHYSWCSSQATPRNQLNPNDSQMLCIGEVGKNCFIRIRSDEYDISLSNPVTRTGSMTPAIPDGSKLITRKPINDDYFVGDIVCYWNKKAFPPSVNQICHRIIEVGDTEIKTKGDNAINDDGWIPKEDVVKIVVGVFY